MDCLRKLRASKESRNALKGLNYDTVRLLRVDFLPPIFNGDVVFELPPIGSSNGNSQAKLMVGMASHTMDMPRPKLLHHTSRMIWA
jgi:hypothetical protein